MNGLINLEEVASRRQSYDPKEVGEVIENYTAEGVYLRLMKIGPGKLAISHVHKYSCVSIMLEGELILLKDDKTNKRIKAPFVFESEGGIRRAIYTLTKVQFATAHGTGHIPDWVAPTKDTKDEMIKRLISCVTHEEYQKFLETRSQYGQIQDLRSRDRLTER